MTSISTQQARQRWDALSETLREAAISEINNEFLINICRTEHLPEDKIRDVSRIAGYVLLGFIHPEDFVQEMKDSLSLAPPLASSIAAAINSRVFTPLKSELDKVYEPPSKLAEGTPPTIEEIRRITPTGLPVFITPSKEAAPPPMAPGGTTKAPPPPSAPEKKPLGEFAKLGLDKTSPSPAEISEGNLGGPAVEGTGGKSSLPPPMIIFGETASKPSEVASRFRSDTPAPKFEEAGKAAPPRPAVIEFRGMEKPVAPPAKAPERPMPKVVHYTEFRTPLTEIKPDIKKEPVPLTPVPTVPVQPTPPKVELPKFSSPAKNLPTQNLGGPAATDIRKPPAVPGTPERSLNIPPPPRPNMDLPELPKPEQEKNF